MSNIIHINQLDDRKSIIYFYLSIIATNKNYIAQNSNNEKYINILVLTYQIT